MLHLIASHPRKLPMTAILQIVEMERNRHKERVEAKKDEERVRNTLNEELMSQFALGDKVYLIDDNGDPSIFGTVDFIKKGWATVTRVELKEIQHRTTGEVNVYPDWKKPRNAFVKCKLEALYHCSDRDEMGL